MASNSENANMTSKFSLYASIATDIGIDKLLDYGIPENLQDKVKKGSVVEINVKGMQRQGYVVEIKKTPDFFPVSPIKGIVSSYTLIPDDLFELALWMSRYYYAPLRNTFKTILPPSVRSDVKNKKQLFVMCKKTHNEIKDLCRNTRKNFPAQAAILDIMLKVKKGIFLSELIEKAQVSTSPIKTLIKKGILYTENVEVDRSPFNNEEYFQTKPKTLTTQQSIALKRITDNLEKKNISNTSTIWNYR